MSHNLEITASSCHQIVEKARQAKGSEDPVQRTGEWGLQVILVVCTHSALIIKKQVADETYHKKKCCIPPFALSNWHFTALTAFHGQTNARTALLRRVVV